jgi:two-component system, cell cycle sensor histidine kinase PleC
VLRAECEGRAQVEAELRAAKEAAERASHAKSQFLANMSHELRTPLNAIIGFADIIARELSGPVGTPVYKEYARDIASSGKQLFDILSNILDMARIEAGRAGISRSEFSLAETLASAVGTCTSDATNSSVSVVCDKTLQLRADERLIRQACVSLISNALKFSDAGRVWIRAQVNAAGGVDIRVQDSGAGIPEDKRDLVVEPFNQPQNVLTRRVGGLGLGLPLAKALIELHGGALSISESTAQSSFVCIQLPATCVVAPAAAVAASVA